MKPVDYAGEGWHITYTSWRTEERKHAYEPTWAYATGFVRTYAAHDRPVILRGGGQQVFVGTYSTKWKYEEK